MKNTGTYKKVLVEINDDYLVDINNYLNAMGFPMNSKSDKVAFCVRMTSSLFKMLNDSETKKNFDVKKFQTALLNAYTSN